MEDAMNQQIIVCISWLSIVSQRYSFPDAVAAEDGVEDEFGVKAKVFSKDGVDGGEGLA